MLRSGSISRGESVDRSEGRGRGRRETSRAEHGITDAFIGAELLADAIAATLDGQEGEHVALDRYQRERDAMAANMMPPVIAAAGLPADMQLVKGAFRGMSQAMREEWDLVESGFGAGVAI